MRNLLAMLGAAIVTVVGVGWYLDWFKVHKSDVKDGKQHYNIEVNTPKIGADLHKGTEKLHTVIDKKFSKKELLTPPAPPAPMDRVDDISPPVIYTGTDRVPEPPTSGGPELTPPLPMPPK